MIHLDATGLLALLVDEPAARDVEQLLREGDVCITAVNYAEVVDQATRVHGRTLAELALALDPLVTGDILRIVAVTPSVGLLAGELRSRHYDRRTCRVSLADCVLLGAARIARTDVATSDQSVADVACAEALRVRALPNSQGARPALP